MRHEFNAQASTHKEIKRVFRSLIEETALHLLHAVDDPERGIHDSRKSLKEIRALLRLLKPVMEKAWYQAESQHYKQLGQALSSSRDAQVMLRTWQRLLQRNGRLQRAEFQSLEHTLEQRLRHTLRRRSSRKQLVDASLELERRRWHCGDWDLPNRQFALLEKGLLRIYERSRGAWIAARENPENQQFHESRKRFKDLYYSLRLIKPMWNRRLKQAFKQLGELNEILGLANDLSVLEAYFKSQLEPDANKTLSFTEAAWRDLFDVLEAEHAELCLQSHQLAAKVLRWENEEFVALCESRWQAHRKN